MYQSPIAALAELVSNAWDADAENVNISLPDQINTNATIIVTDDGIGMTFDECQERYLNVGYARRGDNLDEKSLGKSRPILGRKGIGKFAGFGIACVVNLKTTSKSTGEATEFEMNLDELRTQEYVEKDSGNVSVISHTPPDESKKHYHGTIITLKNLTLSRKLNAEQFSKSMSRRFLLHTRSMDFKVTVDAKPIPDDDDLANIQYDFPNDYLGDERPDELIIQDGWGIEKLPDNQQIKWRIRFNEDPITSDELRGISIFARGKLAQVPFFFQLSGGLSGQHAQQYLCGQIEADFIDLFDHDLISPERQRINWERIECKDLLTWGQNRTKNLLSLWKSRRSSEKQKLLTEKVDGFSDRLEKLSNHEQKTVRQALSKIASISTLKNEQFVELGKAVLTAWEAGRLRDLIDDIANSGDMSELDLLDILIEMNVVTALHTAEAVRAKLDIIVGLHERIKTRALENPIRDYIADNPWLIDPEWETFTKEMRVNKIIQKAAKEAKLDEYEDWKKRVDLVLSSGNTLLVVEFIRPDIPIDHDHLSRFSFYMNAIQSQLSASTVHKFTNYIGYLISDKLDRSPAFVQSLQEHKQHQRYALDWNGLLTRATVKWKEFLKVLVERAPNDARLRSLLEEIELK